MRTTVTPQEEPFYSKKSDNTEGYHPTEGIEFSVERALNGQPAYKRTISKPVFTPKTIILANPLFYFDPEKYRPLVQALASKNMPIGVLNVWSNRIYLIPQSYTQAQKIYAVMDMFFSGGATTINKIATREEIAETALQQDLAADDVIILDLLKFNQLKQALENFLGIKLSRHDLDSKEMQYLDVDELYPYSTLYIDMLLDSLKDRKIRGLYLGKELQPYDKKAQQLVAKISERFHQTIEYIYSEKHTFQLIVLENAFPSLKYIALSDKSATLITPELKKRKDLQVEFEISNYKYLCDAKSCTDILEYYSSESDNNRFTAYIPSTANTIKIANAADIFFPETKQTFSSKTLKLENMSIKHTDLVKLLIVCTELEKLELSEVKITDYTTASYPQLLHLTDFVINGCSELTLNEMIPLINAAPHLQIFSIFGEIKVVSVTASLIKHPAKLTSLSIMSCEIDEDFVANYLAIQNQLTKINFNGTTFTRDKKNDDKEQPPLNLPQLEELDCSTSDIPFTFLEELCRNSQQLKSIDISDLNNDESYDLQDLSLTRHHFEDLNLNHLCQASAKTLVNFLNAQSKLSKLKLCDLPATKDHTQLAHWEGMRLGTLNFLDIYGKMHPKCLQLLLANAPELKTLDLSLFDASDFDDSDFDIPELALSKLEKIILGDDISINIFKAIMNAELPSLTELDLSAIPLLRIKEEKALKSSDIIKQQTRIQSLTLPSSHGAPLLRYFPRVRSLKIKGSFKETNLTDYAAYPLRLESLEFNIIGITESSIQYFLSELKKYNGFDQLKIIKIKSAINISEKLVEFILQNFRYLHTLELTNLILTETMESKLKAIQKRFPVKFKLNNTTYIHASKEEIKQIEPEREFTQATYDQPKIYNLPTQFKKTGHTIKQHRVIQKVYTRAAMGDKITLIPATQADLVLTQLSSLRNRNVVEDFERIYDKKPEYYLVYDKLKLSTGQTKQLVSYGCHNEIVCDEQKQLYLTSNVPLEVHHDARFGFNYVTLTQKVFGEIEVAVVFIVKIPDIEKQYDLSDNKDPIFHQFFNLTDLNSQQFNHKLTLKFIPTYGVPYLDFFVESNRAFTLADLRHHFYSFTPKTHPTGQGYELVNKFLAAETGACEQRAFIFNLIIQQFALENRCFIYENGCHMGVKFFTNNGWYEFNLGGYPATINSLEFPILKKSVAPTKTNHSTFRPTLQLTENITPQTDLKEHKAATATAKPTSPYPLLFTQICAFEASQRNILITMRSPQEAIMIHAALRQEQRNSNRQYHYIHDLNDITKRTYKFTTNGERKEHDSNFIKFLKTAKEGDVLVINWSFFEPHFVGYQTFLDRQFGELSVPEGVIIVSLLPKGIRMREDYYSRHSIEVQSHDLLKIPFDIYHHRYNKVTESKARPEDTIDLTGEDCLEVLRGRIGANVKGQLLPYPGKLLKFLAEGETDTPIRIALINPTKDAKQKFELFMSEVTTGATHFNSEEYHLPQIIFEEVRKPLEFKSKAIIEKLTERSQWDVALNDINHLQLFRIQHFQKQAQFELPGHLQSAAGQSLSILVTSQFSPEQWVKIMAVAAEHKVSLKLILPNGITVPEKIHAESKAEAHTSPQAEFKTPPKAPVSVFVAKDPAAVIDDIIREHKRYRVISIHQNLTFNQLIFNKKNYPTHNKPYPFEYELSAGTVLKDLLEGHTVILKGHLAEDLEKQLETLFARKPYLMINGEKTPIKGKLIIVTPQEKIFNFAKPAKGWLVKQPTGEIKNDDIKVPATTQYEERTNHVIDVLKQSPFVSIQGKTGAGKSTWVKNIFPKEYKTKTGLDIKLHHGLEKLNEWIANGGALVIDEADLEAEGIYEQFEDLFNRWSGRGILVDGQYKPLTENHKLIFIGNGQEVNGKKYADRKLHEFFKRHRATLNFLEIPRAILDKEIIQPFLTTCIPDAKPESWAAIAKIMLDSYTFPLNNPMLDQTPRNLNMMLSYFQLFLQRAREQKSNFNFSLEDIACIASYEELSKIYSPEDSLRLANELFKKPGLKENSTTLISPPLKPIEGFAITPSRAHVLNVLQNCLLLAKTKTGKKGILIEGPSGIGKSTLILKFLKNLGIDIVVLTAAPLDEMKQKASRAIENKHNRLTDEINTLPGIEKFLNEVMDTTDSVDIGTQNSARFPGRKILSPAFLNRFTVIKMDEPCEAEIMQILLHTGISEAKATELTQQYLDERQRLSTTRKPLLRELLKHAASAAKPSQAVIKMDTSDEPAKALTSDPDKRRKRDEEKAEDLREQGQPAAKRRMLAPGLFATDQSDSTAQTRSATEARATAQAMSLGSCDDFDFRP